MFSKNRIYIVLLLLAFVLALGLRLYKLSSVPNGLHVDEASLGYNAYSLIKTGHDEAGHFLPLYIDMFGDNRPTGYHFLDMIPVFFLGLTIFATRLPSAIFGSLIVFAVYFLADTVFRDKRVSIISAFLVAVAPWSVVLSRASGEAVVALFFILCGFAFLLRSFRAKKVSYIVIGTILLIISFFFYHTPRVYVPSFFLVIVIFTFFKWKSQVTKFKAFMIGSFLITSIISFCLVFLVSGGTGRFSQVNIFSFPATKLVLAEQISEDTKMGTNKIESRLFHNKATSYFVTASSNYLEYFSPDFLFLTGGLPRWYIVPHIGELLLIELPFLLMGIYFIFRKITYESMLFIACLLLVPVTAAFTVDDIPNVNRVIELFPFLNIIVAVGLVNFIIQFSNKRLKTFIITIIAILFVYNFAYFLHQYFINSRVQKNWYRNEGFEQVMDNVKKNYSKYDHVIITKSMGGIYPLVLFYMKYDPATYQKEGSPKDHLFGGFGKFYFVSEMCPSINGDARSPKGKIIFVEDGTCEGGANAQHEYINRLDGSPVYKVVYGQVLEK